VSPHSVGRGHIRNLAGQTFGDLTVPADARPVRKEHGKIWWKADCACGEKGVLVRASRLTSGKTKSCGHKREGPRRDLKGTQVKGWKVGDFDGGQWSLTCPHCPASKWVSTALLGGKRARVPPCSCRVTVKAVRTKHGDAPDWPDNGPHFRFFAINERG